MFEVIDEGSARIYVGKDKKISKKLPVFYNPLMKFNRDISVLVLSQFSDMRICDPLAASGVRSIRILKETGHKDIFVNDFDASAVKIIEKNLSLNKLKFSIIKNNKNLNNKKTKKITVDNQDAELFLLKNKGFDYIDIDPYGSPNKFLDSAIKRISRSGILAVTATDLAPLCGTIPKACMRKYWAKPLHGAQMHEIGLRILIRKIQLIGAQYERALIPVFSYFKDHYYRIFFKCVKGKQKVDVLLKLHGEIMGSGPMYLGSLFEKELIETIFESFNSINKILNNNVSINNNKSIINQKTYKNLLNNSKTNKNLKKLLKNNPSIFIDKELLKYLTLFNSESKKNIVGFYDIHVIIKQNQIKTIMRKEKLIKILKMKGYFVSETSFCPTGIKSDVSFNDLLKILKN